MPHLPTPLSRRAMLRHCGTGVGMLGLSSILHAETQRERRGKNPLAPRAPHFRARAKRALEIGCDGVISSGLEARELREELGEGFLIGVPGIRPVANVDDQKRTVDVEDAFLNGADYIVVGRPIRNAPDPAKAAEEIQARLDELVAS